MEVGKSDQVIWNGAFPATPPNIEGENSDSDWGGQEEKEDYRYGGYHPVKIGEIYNGQYKVVRKLGWGIKSTAWLCREIQNGKIVALKIMKSSRKARNDAQEEIMLLKWIQEADPNDERKMKTVQLLDDFTTRGPNGKHVCMVLEIWGPDLGDIIYCNKNGLTIPDIKFMMKQILEALDYLHTKCGIRHGNINPTNIVTWPKPSFVTNLAKLTENMIKSSGKLCSCMRINAPKEYPRIVTGEELMKTGKVSKNKKKSLKKKAKKLSEQMNDTNAPKADEHNCESKNEMEEDEIGEGRVPITDLKIKLRDKDWHNEYTTVTCQQPPHRYRSPEMQLGLSVGKSTDIWSLACIAFELATGNYLFNPVHTQEGCCVACAEEHLALITSLLGEIPKEIRLEGPNSPRFFNLENGNFKHAKEQDPCSLFDTLTRKYEMNVKDAREFCEFLLPMLDYDKDKRATAAECLQHEWILSFENEELEAAESETEVQVKTVEENSTSTRLEGGDADIESGLRVQGKEEKPGQSGDVHADPISKSTVNASPGPEVQTAEEKTGQGCGTGTDSID